MRGASRQREQELDLARMLFRDLAATVDAALGEDQGVEEQIDSSLENAANRARAGALGRAAFDGIGREDVHRLERAFTAAREISAWAEIEVPEPEAFWAGGVDRVAVSRALEADASLIPVPTPHGLGADTWAQMFRASARSPESPLSLASPLALAAEVSAEFTKLDITPPGTPAISGTSRVSNESIRWTLRLIPASPVPARVNMNHVVGPHPTLPEMLMLQLMLLAMNGDVVDRNSFTWLHGVISDGRFAARHFFDAAQRSVGVNTREIGSQGPHLGVRPPIG